MCYKDCANCKHGLDINSDYQVECEEDGKIHDLEDTCDGFEE